VLLKPDCVQRRLAGRVISRFEDKGLNIVAMKLMRVTPELAKRHYAEHVEKKWYPTLEAFITGGPLIAMIVEGREAISVVRTMVGATDGLAAAPGTARPCFRRGGIGLARDRDLFPGRSDRGPGANPPPLAPRPRRGLTSRNAPKGGGLLALRVMGNLRNVASRGPGGIAAA
jgi:nucleoside diphosphate kinase